MPASSAGRAAVRQVPIAIWQSCRILFFGFTQRPIPASWEDEVLVNLKGIVSNIFPLSDIQYAMDESVRNKADIVKSVIKID